MDKEQRYYLNLNKDENNKIDRKPVQVESDILGPNNSYEVLNVFFIEKKSILLDKPVAYMIRNIKKGIARIYTEETAIKYIKSLSFSMAIKNVRVKLEDGKEQIVAMEGYPDIKSDFYKIVIKDGKMEKKFQTIATVVYIDQILNNKINSKMVSFSSYINQYFL